MVKLQQPPKARNSTLLLLLAEVRTKI
jgi:hypothetical protein